ncbi:hypothetical protein PsYK624_052220 [Phanerochaete sordida]|uniref:Secreted protein n=1 Tax=Phanerochaete sordida TaxID=48140 RepID=A0A9P3LCF7_9APHY|nr:hypothetical protein PsYK624_052220 [Phanerochaete sordida]
MARVCCTAAAFVLPLPLGLVVGDAPGTELGRIPGLLVKETPTELALLDEELMAAGVLLDEVLLDEVLLGELLGLVMLPSVVEFCELVEDSDTPGGRMPDVIETDELEAMGVSDEMGVNDGIGCEVMLLMSRSRELTL